MITIPLSAHEMEITYRINNGQAINFFVPGRNQNMRWAAHSVSLSRKPLGLHVAKSGFPVQRLLLGR
jgi:hypothetical protein